MNRKVDPVLHATIVAKYNAGHTLFELGREYDLTGAGIRRIIAHSGIPNRGRSWGDRSRRGIQNSNNHMWRGDNVGLISLHEWVRARKPKPQWCEQCNGSPPFDLATINKKYTRNPEDWEWLCRSCHMKKDSRINNLKQFAGVHNGK